MAHYYFVGVADVEIQGSRVLEVVKHWPECVEYNVIGFQGKIKLRDYRRVGLQAIETLERVNQIEEFLKLFCTSAEIVIYRHQTGHLHVDLHDAEITSAKYMLWIAVGLEDYIPLYDYVFKRVEFCGVNQLALLSVYRRPTKAKPSKYQSNNQNEANKLFETRRYEPARGGDVDI